MLLQICSLNAIIMDNLIIRPAWPQAVPSPQFPFINLDDIPEATIVDYKPVETPSNIHFLEANTDSITMYALTSDCIVPTWGNQELTIKRSKAAQNKHLGITTDCYGKAEEIEKRLSGVGEALDSIILS